MLPRSLSSCYAGILKGLASLGSYSENHSSHAMCNSCVISRNQNLISPLPSANLAFCLPLLPCSPLSLGDSGISFLTQSQIPAVFDSEDFWSYVNGYFHSVPDIFSAFCMIAHFHFVLFCLFSFVFSEIGSHWVFQADLKL